MAMVGIVLPLSFAAVAFIIATLLLFSLPWWYAPALYLCASLTSGGLWLVWGLTHD